MSDTKHTPGPWHVGDINTNPNDGVLGEVAVCAKTDRTPTGSCTPAVALPFADHSLGREMAMANARMIAAAPDMLAALKTLSCVDFERYTEHDELLLEAAKKEAAAAIAKAEGRPIPSTK